MKKIVALILTLGVLFSFGCTAKEENVKNELAENHNYTMKNCVVTEATETGCLIVDENGEGWYLEGEGFEVGEIVELEMHDNFTEDIYDDVLENVTK